MKESNHLEELIKENWESIKNCKPNEKVEIKIKQENGNIVIHGKCVPK